MVFWINNVCFIKPNLVIPRPIDRFNLIPVNLLIKE